MASSTFLNISSMASALLLLFGLLLPTLDTTNAQIGVCYGMFGGNLPSKPDVISLFNQNGIKRMRLYDPNAEALQALRGSDIELMLGLPDALQRFASSQSEADTWVLTNVQPYAADVKFKYIVVGNELKPEEASARYLAPAMMNIQKAVNRVGLGGRIKVSTAIDTGSLQESYPPSRGSFKQEYRMILDPVIKFLKDNRSPMLVNLYTYFAVKDDPNISLDYALFRSEQPVVSDPPFSYSSLFDAMLDSVYAALEKANGGSLEIVVSETGWPTAGSDGKLTNVANAMAYNNNLIQRVKRGSPKRPGMAIETYIFAMFDENAKTGAETEKHWGLFSPTNKQLKYPVKFN